MSRSVIFALLLAMLLGGCIRMGDPGFSIRVVNRLDETVLYFASGVGEKSGAAASSGIQLTPDQADVDHWTSPTSRIGDDRRAKVRAQTLDGRLLYCRTFSWNDLKEAAFVVEIRRGEIFCGN